MSSVCDELWVKSIKAIIDLSAHLLNCTNCKERKRELSCANCEERKREYKLFHTERDRKQPTLKPVPRGKRKLDDRFIIALDGLRKRYAAAVHNRSGHHIVTVVARATASSSRTVQRWIAKKSVPSGAQMALLLRCWKKIQENS